MTLISRMDHLGGIAHAFCTFFMLENRAGLLGLGLLGRFDMLIRVKSRHQGDVIRVKSRHEGYG